MSRKLPAQPSLRQLQIQAKELAKALKRFDADAIKRLREHHPHFIESTDDRVRTRPLQLNDAQWVVAREHGFESWPKLRAHVDRVTLGRLAEAVEQGDVAEAQSLLRQSPGLIHMDMAENDEHRVLHYAVLRRDSSMVRMLMDAGADPHKGIYPHRDATSAYVLARDRGFVDIISVIDEQEETRRKQMSCPNASITPEQEQLYNKMRQGDHAAALAILESQPTIARACDRDGGTPLHIACEEGAIAEIDWLLAHGADPEHKNQGGRTPLESAVLRVGWKERQRCGPFPDVTHRLLNSGAEMTPLVAAALGDVQALRGWWQRDSERMAAVPDIYGTGLLSISVTFDKHAALKLLLDFGLDVNERHRLRDLEEEVFTSGQPLWLAAAFGEHEMAVLLLEHGADPSAPVYASGSPVHRAYGAHDERIKALLACHGGHPTPDCIGWYRDVDTARRLLESACSEEDVEGLLWGAACGGAPEIVAMALKKIHWPSTDSRWSRILVSPLSLANHTPASEHPELFDRSTYPACLSLILQHGVDVNVASSKGETLIHRVAAAGKSWGRDVMTDSERSEFALITLDASPDLSVRDNLLRSTPLGWASRWGRRRLVQLLLEHGANPDEPEAEPWATPLAWATKMGHDDVAALLRASGANQ